MTASKQRGTRWESLVVEYLRGAGWPNAERRALAGAKDRGDVAGVVGMVVEAKAARRIELAGWVDEANTERDNDGADIGVVWIKRPGRGSPKDGYVVMDGETFVLLAKEAGY